MFRTIKAWLAPSSAPAPANPRLTLETLDRRDMPSVSLIGSTLTITGSYLPDSASVSSEGAYIVVRATQPNPATGRVETVTKSYDPSLVRDISFRGGEGGDTFLNGTGKPCVAYGEGGNDNLTGGSGADRLYGGDSDDTLVLSVDGQWGNTQGAGGRSLAGRNLSLDVFDGGNGYDTVLGTDTHDAILLDDPTATWGVPRQRLKGVEHIDARGGDDVVDLSVFTNLGTEDQRPDLGENVVVEGGWGRDTLVGNKNYYSDLYGGLDSDTLIAKHEWDLIDGGENTGDWDIAYVFADQWLVVGVESRHTY